MKRSARGWATLTVVVAAAVSAATLTVAPAASASVGDPSKAVAADGAKVTAETVIDARTVDLTVSSPALGGSGMVRLILPKSWNSKPTWSFPTVYLLHGPDVQDYKAWTYYTKVEEYAQDSDVIVAMPTGGASAIYTDEYDSWGKVRPKWETFHTVELPQILAGGYRANGKASIAGISSGGFGALSYAARHPQMFSAVGAYSAMTDLFDPAGALAVLKNRIAAGQSLDPFGPLLVGVANKLQRNPQTLVARYRGQRLYVSSGGGLPGPLDKTDPNYHDQVGGRVIEGVTSAMDQRFASTAKLFGARVTTHFYPGGLHYWTYWDRELGLSWSFLTTPLGAPTDTAPSGPSSGPNGSSSSSPSSSTSSTPSATPAPAGRPAPKKTGLLGGLFGGLFG
ncbi:alpha/beta hydrolase [Spongisporangium articulatum]|uniref:Alpha/beta hydrolase n=1 Tax=Spongisporangium articulatum TaxID=3362603 RepID=A0ABW8AIL6_9ACTN